MSLRSTGRHLRSWVSSLTSPFLVQHRKETVRNASTDAMAIVKSSAPALEKHGPAIPSRKDTIGALPPEVRPYKRTASFTETTIPAGLLAEHSTKAGTWGLISVEEGALRYVITDPRRPYRESVLSADSDAGIVEPTIVHRVEPIGAVRFYVEFFR